MGVYSEMRMQQLQHFYLTAWILTQMRNAAIMVMTDIITTKKGIPAEAMDAEAEAATNFIKFSKNNVLYTLSTPLPLNHEGWGFSFAYF